MTDDTRPVVVLSGASGFIGSAFTARVTELGWRVRPLVRRAPTSADEIRWDPDRGKIQAAAISGARAVVHLAGEPIAQRWSEAVKQRIRDSRVRGTELLAGALARLPEPPQLLLSGSAVGYYGDRGDEPLDETSGPGTDFLGEVGKAWEEAALPAAGAGIRVAWLRTGIVLSRHGGALAKMLPVFRIGLGGRIGPGSQWMSWISLTDQVEAMVHLLATPGIEGPFNLVSPSPVTAATFASELGRALRRPAILPVPPAALRLLYGEMADATLLAGQKAMPRRLVASGYDFAHRHLSEALAEEL